MVAEPLLPWNQKKAVTMVLPEVNLPSDQRTFTCTTHANVIDCFVADLQTPDAETML